MIQFFNLELRRIQVLYMKFEIIVSSSNVFKVRGLSMVRRDLVASSKNVSLSSSSIILVLQLLGMVWPGDIM
jgi:hypothetical protein